MTHIKSHAWLTALALPLAIAGLLIAYTGRASTQPPQDAERSLDIERYPNEPLELVSLMVGGQSLKDKIKFKSKNSINGWGLDSVKFKEKDGWFKHLKIRLRNVSGRPIYGIRASLVFKPPASQTHFGLPLARNKRLEQEPLQSGEEIDLDVIDQLFNRTMEIMEQRGADANKSEVSLSVEGVLFTADADLQWSKGVLLRRDPNNRNKWVPVIKPAAMLLSQRLSESVGSLSRLTQDQSCSSPSCLSRM